MTQVYAALYVLRDGKSRDLTDIALEVSQLTGQPRHECNSRGRVYKNSSRALIWKWRVERFVEDSQINTNLPYGHWKITQAGIDYLRRNPEP